MDIMCSDQLHASRAGLPGYADVVARGSVATDGMICGACAVARQTAATDDTNPLNSITVRRDGVVYATKMRTYGGGVIVGQAGAQTTLSALAPAQQAALLTLLTGLWDAAVPAVAIQVVADVPVATPAPAEDVTVPALRLVQPAEPVAAVRGTALARRAHPAAVVAMALGLVVIALLVALLTR